MDRLEEYLRKVLDEEGTGDGEEEPFWLNQADSEDGPNWASFKPSRTSEGSSSGPHLLAG